MLNGVVGYANLDEDGEDLAGSASKKVFAYSLKKKLRKMFACLPCFKKQRARCVWWLFSRTHSLNAH